MIPAGSPGYIVWADAVTPLGDDWESTWAALLAGRTAVDAWEPDDPAYAVGARVAMIKALERGIDRDGNSSAFRLGRQMARRIAAAGYGACPVFGGANHGDSDLVVHLAASLAAPDPSIPASLWAAMLSDRIPAAFAPQLRGWNASACASGMHALVDGVMELGHGESPFAVAAVIDALSPVGIAGFARAGACGSARSRPFGLERDGLAIGEAAAALSVGRAPEGAIAAILGIGMSCDAWHATDPDPSGAGLERAIRQALSRAGLEPSAVAAVVAHGTATRKNDAIEAAAIARIWPGRDVAVTSLKHGLGHPMGAAGILNVLCAAQGSREGRLPPVSKDAFGSEPAIDLVVGEPRPMARGLPVLALASGFGGNNVAVLVQGMDR